jgi:hypothetical protein|tara:strand:+ start:19664 stop:19834 length:171 start_codon:yes stop_codon:yes gene_type:complete
MVLMYEISVEVLQGCGLVFVCAEDKYLSSKAERYPDASRWSIDTSPFVDAMSGSIL